MAGTEAPAATEPVHPTFETAADLLDRLGGIPPGRIRMRPPPGTATEADVVTNNEEKLGLCELFDGTLVEKAVGLDESLLAITIASILHRFVVAHNLGIITGADGMMRLAPGNIRVPDVAFLSWDRTPDGRGPWTAYSELAPDLAVEVLSPSSTRAEMNRKRVEYFAAGVRLVWEVASETRTVDVFTAPQSPTLLDSTMTLDGGEVLPGFRVAVAELFADLDRQRP